MNISKAMIENKRHSIFTTNSIYNAGQLNLNKSDNCKQNTSTTSTSKVKLRSNSIFAFNNNDKYSNIFSFENRDIEDISDLMSIGNVNNMNISNFFSNVGEPTSMQTSTNMLFNLIDKQSQSEGSFCTISSEVEKNLDGLVDFPGDDLNEAKLDLRFKSDNISGIRVKEKRNETYSLGSSAKSEKYDEVDEFSLNNDLKVNDRLQKRMSVGSGSSMTHYTSNPHLERLIKIKLGNLNNANNYEYDINRSINSMDFSASHNSSCSPNVSYSPTKNRSLINSTTNTNSATKLNEGGVIFLSPTGKFKYSQPQKGNNSNNFFLNNFSPNQPVQPPFSLTLNHPFVHPNSINNSFSLDGNRNNYNTNQIGNNLHPGAFSMNTGNTISVTNTPPVNVNNNYTATPTHIFPQRYNNYSTFNSPQNQSFTSNKPNNRSTNTSADFKNKSSNNIQSPNFSSFLQDDTYMLENILILLKDQNGCRMVQQKLKEKGHDKDFVFQFFEKIKPNLNDIVNDQFGNYVTQKFIDIIQNQGDKNLLAAFFERIRNNLYVISVNHYGTRFFQKTLECLTPVYSRLETDGVNDALRQLVQEHLFDLILDTNGNHVFQKILFIYPKNKNQFIYDALTKAASKIAKLKQGGCIFGRAFDCATMEQRRQLVLEILNHFNLLINDEYGNFIIQQIVFLKDYEFNDIIFKAMKDNIATLSKKKFSSNVIDKCILYDDHLNKNKLRNNIIDHLVENKLVGELICDQFGNYVIQKALQVSDGLKFMAIIHEIKAAVKMLKQTSNGRKIYENLTMQYGDYFHQNISKYKNINDGRRNSHMNTFTLQNKFEK